MFPGWVIESPPEIEERVLDYALHFPTHGQVRAANELKKKGIQISAGGIRSIWLRHDLQVKALRLKRLEAWAAENKNILTESQVQALEEAEDKRQAHGEVESPHPGFLIAQDTYYVGTIKGIGRIYQQTVIDTHANVGFAKVYRERTALTAADTLNDKVLPFYDQHGIRVLRALTDNGGEYRGRKDGHPYELFLHLNEIEHTLIKVRHPQTNGSVERLNQTIKEEFYQIAFRKKTLFQSGGDPGRPGRVHGNLQHRPDQPGQVLPGPDPFTDLLRRPGTVSKACLRKWG